MEDLTHCSSNHLEEGEKNFVHSRAVRAYLCPYTLNVWRASLLCSITHTYHEPPQLQCSPSHRFCPFFALDPSLGNRGPYQVSRPLTHSRLMMGQYRQTLERIPHGSCSAEWGGGKSSRKMEDVIADVQTALPSLHRSCIGSAAFWGSSSAWDIGGLGVKSRGNLWR